MATIREIRRRISAVKSTQKITRAMQMVAAAKLRRAQENIIRARPYAMKLENTIAQVAMRTKRDLHALLADKPDVKKVLLVVITSDSGLCGGYNANTIRAARHYLEDQQAMFRLICSAWAVKDGISSNEWKCPSLEKKTMFFNHMKYADAVQIVSAVKDRFLDGGYDKVEVLYNEFKSAITQILRFKQLLPLQPAEPPEGVTPIDYIYEPDEYTVFNTLIPYNLEIQVWRVLLESLASEMGAKMTAMDAATENASDLINSLTITYNRARQALITNEISEIVGGAEGLKG